MARKSAKRQDQAGVELMIRLTPEQASSLYEQLNQARRKRLSSKDSLVTVMEEVHSLSLGVPPEELDAVVNEAVAAARRRAR